MSNKQTIKPSLKDYLINNYIGRGIWERIKTKKTRYILMKDARDAFKADIIQKYGSYYNYKKYLAKKCGCDSPYELELQRIKDIGFKTSNQYLKFLAKKKGFESLNDQKNHLAKKRGFKNEYDRDKNRILARGFKNESEYRNYLAHQKGFKNHYQYKKAKKTLVN